MMDPFAPKVKLREKDQDFLDEMIKQDQMFVITDSSFDDSPIVYASRRFLEYTGYSESEVVGRNCRFLQGPETDVRDVMSIRKAVEAGENCALGVVNYTKGGKKFYNQFFLTPLRGDPRMSKHLFNNQGRIRYLVGVQSPSDEASFKAKGYNVRNYGKVFRDKQRVSARDLQMFL